MIEISIQEKDLLLGIPESLEDLSTEAYLRYCELLQELKSGAIEAPVFLALVFYAQNNIVATLNEDPAKNENLAYIVDQMQGFFYEEEGHLHVHKGLVRNLVPIIDWQGERFPGPADMLFDLPFGPFVEAYRVFGAIQKSEAPSEDALRYLLMVLYKLPEKLAFNAAFPLSYAWAAYYFFEACVEQITTQPVSVHGEELPLHEIFNSPGKKGGKSPELAFDPVLFDLGENGVFGAVSNLKEQPLYEVLRYLYRKLLQAREEKRKHAQR